MEQYDVCEGKVTIFNSNSIAYSSALITNFACDELIMKIVWVRSFIGLYILYTNIMHWKPIWHMDKCVDKWSTNLWMNECHTNFTSSNKFVCQVCFQCTILICEMYELWMN